MTFVAFLLVLAVMLTSSACMNETPAAVSRSGLFPVHECGGGYAPGPWTTCPRAAWVRKVVEAAGYRLISDTGSALVAAGGGTSFYIWANDPDRTTLEAEVRGGIFRSGPRVAGVRVYRDRVRLSWRAQGLVFWLEPRTAAADTFRAKRLHALGEASRTAPPPP